MLSRKPVQHCEHLVVVIVDCWLGRRAVALESEKSARVVKLNHR